MDMNIIKNLINKNLLLIALVVWLIIAISYLNRTGPEVRSTDWWGHLPYTKIIATEHRRPKPQEGWQTYNPPLYYIINSFIATSKIKTNDYTHKQSVRLASILYGIIVLIIIYWFLKQVTQDKLAQILTLLFIGTTPNYIFVFSIYNNDSLVTLFCVLLLFLCYKLNIKWSWKLAICFLIAAVAAIYTKYTALWCILTLCILNLLPILNKKLPSKNQIKIISILIFSTALLLPWLVFHNYRYSHKLFPFNDYSIFAKKITPGFIVNNAFERLKIPVLQEPKNTWDDPYIHSCEGKSTKRPNYWSIVFVHSVINEWTFLKPDVEITFLMIWIQLINYLLNIS